jgi:hypothetical protein
MKNKYLVAGLLLSSLAINAEEAKTNTAVDAAVANVKDTAANLIDTAENKLAVAKDTAANLIDTAVDKLAAVKDTAKNLVQSAVDETSKTLDSKNTAPALTTVNDSKDKVSEVLPLETTQAKVNLTPSTVVSTTKIEATKESQPLTKTTTTTTTVVKELNLVETTKHNWWKWLGLLALLGALLGFLAATFKRRDHEKEPNNSPRKNRHSDREVEFTFEEEKENKTSDKRNHNNDFKNRD